MPVDARGVALGILATLAVGLSLGVLYSVTHALLHREAEAMRRAFTDRNTYLGDPAFVKNPIDRLHHTDLTTITQAEGGVLIMDVSGVHSGANPISGQFSVGATGWRIAAVAQPVPNHARLAEIDILHTGAMSQFGLG